MEVNCNVPGILAASLVSLSCGWRLLFTYLKIQQQQQQQQQQTQLELFGRLKNYVAFGH